MSRRLVVDAHAHLYPSTVVGEWSKESYDLWEYGSAGSVPFGPDAGSLADLSAGMRSGGVEHAVALNAFSIAEWQDRWLAGLGDGLDTDAAALTDPAVPPLAAALVRCNEWLVEAVAAAPQVTPFVAVDPWLLPFRALAEHLAQMRERGARGVKIHPVEQRFRPGDPRMSGVYRRCAELA
jgi:uncharacterized protein